MGFYNSQSTTQLIIIIMNKVLLPLLLASYASCGTILLRPRRQTANEVATRIVAVAKSKPELLSTAVSQADPALLRVALTDADPKLLDVALTKARPDTLATALTRADPQLLFAALAEANPD